MEDVATEEHEAERLRRALVRYHFLLGTNTDPRTDKVIRELIDEAEMRLTALDSRNRGRKAVNG